MHIKLLSILLLFQVFGIINKPLNSKETVIYIVRHAEKETADPADNNPELNETGKRRAKDLAAELKKETFAAVFSTNYKRTLQTAAPVAQRSGLPVLTYKPDDFKNLAELVKSEYHNKKILIVGHSNTILEIAKAFGTDVEIEKLNDDDYDLLIKITINNNGVANLKFSRYGQKHHSTELPDEVKSFHKSSSKTKNL
ncbi:MAG: histidine phosphatase family protein [Daejeonella sp.]